MSLFLFEFAVKYVGWYDKSQSIGAKLAYDLGYRNSSNITEHFRDMVRWILQNYNISIADIRERMKWHETNGVVNMWHHIVKDGIVKQSPFFSPLEVAGWYEDKFVIPSIVANDRWFNNGYRHFKNKCKKNTLRNLKSQRKLNDEKNYSQEMKKVYKQQLRNRMKEGKIGKVQRHLEFVYQY